MTAVPALIAGIGLFALLGSAVLSITTIAVAWVVFRPVLGISLLVVALAALVWRLKIGISRKKGAAPAPPVA